MENKTIYSIIFLCILIQLIHFTTSFDARNGISRPWDNLTKNKVDLDGYGEIKQFLKNLKGESSAFTILKSLTNLKKSEDYKEYFVKVQVDHFAYDNDKTFNLRYLVNDKYFVKDKKGLKSPILFYCGNEGGIEEFYNSSGYVTETLAKELSALVIFAEHRFFGKSFPFGGVQDHDIEKNKYLTVEQAMADFVELLDIYKTENKLDNPVIAFGGSYGGMLSSWSRMKFPHVFLGAVASSAPILLFENIDKISNNFFKIVTDTYKRYDSECPTHLRSGFSVLNEIRNNPTPVMLKELNDIFKPCSNITNTTHVKMLEDAIEDAIVALAQYNYPYVTTFFNPTPGEPVKVACEKVGEYKNKTIGGLSPLMLGSLGFTYSKYNQVDPLTKTKLHYLKETIDVFFNHTGTQTCLDIGDSQDDTPTAPNGWFYLACTEMVMPMQKNGETDMFNPVKWDEEKFGEECKKVWKADYRPRWAFRFFGGKNFAKELHQFSNIIFINGKMDPWNAGCPQESNNPDVIVIEADSAHHLDLRLPHPKDPFSIIHARKITLGQIKKWITEDTINSQ